MMNIDGSIPTRKLKGYINRIRPSIVTYKIIHHPIHGAKTPNNDIIT
jgi:hypothetical protein